MRDPERSVQDLNYSGGDSNQIFFFSCGIIVSAVYYSMYL